MTQPLTLQAQARNELLQLTRQLATITAQLHEANESGAYTLALGFAELAVSESCILKLKLARAALAQRN